MTNFAALEAKLLDLSDPASPNYAQWMSQDEVNALTAPPAAARAAASAYLAAEGARCTDMPHSLKCTATVEVVNKIFATSVTAFEHTANKGARVLRVHPDTAYAFPDALRGSVDFVTSLVDFPTVRRKLGKVTAHGEQGSLRGLQGVDYSILPESLAAIYGSAKGCVHCAQPPPPAQLSRASHPPPLFAAAQLPQVLPGPRGVSAGLWV